jgi:hypothetical protein
MRLLAVVGLVLVLVGLSLTALGPVFAQPSGYVGIGKACIPTERGVMFHFAVTEPDNQGGLLPDLGCDVGYAYGGVPADVTYVFTELVSENPPEWVFRDITCVQIAGSGQSSWEIAGASVTIHHDADDVVSCLFTNTGPSAPVATQPPQPYELCVIQLGVQEPNGTVAWLPGYTYPGTPISQCQNRTEYYADVLGRTIVVHQFNQTRIY